MVQACKHGPSLVDAGQARRGLPNPRLQELGPIGRRRRRRKRSAAKPASAGTRAGAWAHQRHLLHAIHYREREVEDEQRHPGDSEQRQLVVNQSPSALQATGVYLGADSVKVHPYVLICGKFLY